LIKFFIDQHGCAKNQVDGELIVSRLIAQGYEQTFDVSQAALIIINSCGFIETAKKESLDAVIAAHKNYPDAKILLAGCLAQRYAPVLHTDLPEADGIFGNGDITRVSDIAGAVMRGERPVLIPAQKGVCGGDRDMLLSFPGAAYVKITEGCNNHCSFCAIPLIRGELRSRPAADIIAEVKLLVDRGVYELNLIGQDLAAYGSGCGDDVFGDGRASLQDVSPDGLKSLSVVPGHNNSFLCRLLQGISALPGTFRIRLLYIHPDHFNRDILSVIKSDTRFLPYFDIPFQSGDDEIIRLMNRTGSAASYKNLVADIRAELPDAAIRTTFLTGFPGESDEAASRTISFLEEIQPDWSGCFPYSKEDDTPGAQMRKQIPRKIAQARADYLTALQSSITRLRLSSRCGKVYDVLIEEVIAPGEENPSEGLAIGRAWFQAPEVDGSVVVHYDRDDDDALAAVQSGRLVCVSIQSGGDVDLDGIFARDSELNKMINRSQIRFAETITGDE